MGFAGVVDIHPALIRWFVAFSLIHAPFFPAVLVQHLDIGASIAKAPFGLINNAFPGMLAT